RSSPADPELRIIARTLSAAVRDLPTTSPQGHTDPQSSADTQPFPDPATLLVIPGHYIFRMLYSQGVRLEDFGVCTLDCTEIETDPRKIWRLFASHYFLFRGTPTRIWFDWVLANVFELDVPLTAENADHAYDT